MELDVATVQAITVLPFAIMAVFLFWTWWTDRSNPALAWWSLADAFAAGSAIMTYLGAGSREGVNVILDDVLFLLAHLALLFGFAAFQGRPLPWITAAAALGVYVTFVLVGDILAVDAIRIAIALAIMITALMIAELRSWRGTLTNWRNILTGLAAAHLLILVARFSKGPVTGLPPIDSPQHWLTVAFLLAPIILPIAFGYSVLGMFYERREAALRLAALRDPLTGALNRRGLEEWLLLLRARRSGRRRPAPASMAAIAVDIDRFKSINDRHGHAAGDEVLKALVETLASEIRPDDALARFGGEEFVILMPGATAVGAHAAAERMRAVLMARSLPIDGLDGPITASFGVAFEEGLPGFEGLNELLERADRALYRAKRSGRNRVTVDGAEQETGYFSAA